MPHRHCVIGCYNVPATEGAEHRHLSALLPTAAVQEDQRAFEVAVLQQREAEIEDVRRYLIGIGPLANETAGDVARQACTLAAAGRGSGFVNEHMAALRRPAADDATAAFHRVVDPSQLGIAVTGPADVLESALREIGLEFEVI